jgi:hypothetical protein
MHYLGLHGIQGRQTTRSEINFSYCPYVYLEKAKGIQVLDGMA